MKRLVLGLESGGEHLSAALFEGSLSDRRVLGEVLAHRGPRHAELALSLVSELLAHAQVELAELSLIAVGRGPGGFTGVRIALSLGLGLSLASKVPIWPVSSLAALAMNARVPGLPVLALIDAKKHEVYAALTRLRPGAPPLTLLAPRVVTCEAAVAEAREVVGQESLIVLGSGALAYGVASPLPAAAHVASAGATAELAFCEWAEAGFMASSAPPCDAVYLRKSEAEVAKEARAGGVDHGV